MTPQRFLAGGQVGRSAAITRKVSPSEAIQFRRELVARLGTIAPQWSAMSDASLSKLLVGERITTATGLRFDPDRVREFRRSLAKVDAEAPYASNDPAVAAEAMRVLLLQIISELREPMTDDRRAEIDRQVRAVGLVLCEDRFADHALLHKALEMAERHLSAAAFRPA
jgi:hypothetical protein